MGKTFSKYRQDREYYDDEFINERKESDKKRKKENAQLRKMRMRQFEDDSYGYEDPVKNYRYR